MRTVIIAFIFSFFIIINASALSVNEISAKAGIVIEGTTGKIIFSKNGEKRMKPASTTKILTALCALEFGNTDDVITVSEKAANEEGSSMYIEAGEKIKLENLIYGLMLNSGNDAAVSIAEHISGSEEKFSLLMNKKAKESGATNSNFVNPNGLDNDNHYVTAYDLALITSKAMENEKFREIVKTKNKLVSTENGNKKYLSNHNKLLNVYNGCIGGKTGFTKASGRTLVSVAERNGVEIIAVTLNAPDDWNDHIRMLDYGFSQIEEAEIIKEGGNAGYTEVKNGVLKKCPLIYEKGYKHIKIKNNSCEVKIKYSMRKAKAPIMKNEILGKCYVYIDNEKVFETRLIAGEKIDKKENKKGISYIFKRFLNYD